MGMTTPTQRKANVRLALILASTPYDASDYIEDFNLYKTTLANGK